MEKRSGVELNMEPQEGGGLKELVLRWFTETQAPLVQHNGNFPDWFQGLATRKEAEELLRDKSMGCFLIRLSNKAFGYILSYKGNDRCRHFVITQNQDGHFIISGDSQTYGSLTELIQHYKVSAIQPFGEYLTSSCNEVRLFLQNTVSSLLVSAPSSLLFMITVGSYNSKVTLVSYEERQLLSFHSGTYKTDSLVTLNLLTERHSAKEQCKPLTRALVDRFHNSST
uniref:SH2 domain containing 7 n=1 Tax=Haplochromis burtoni TaxID=8153 RepID=A0A3Q2X707_HAPBU